MQESAKSEVTISIIIPVLNEREGVIKVVDYLRKIKGGCPIEIIVVDGDKKGSTIQYIHDKDVIAIKSQRGRAIQMNNGAKRACGDVLLFLHADTFIPHNAFEHIIAVMRTEKYVGGAFDLGFVSKKWVFKLIASVASLRSRITRIPFGDQTIFIKRNYFEKIGGYTNIPFMEDIELMQRIKKRGDKIHIIPAKVITSTRKWEEDGTLFTMLRNWLLQFFYLAGVSPKKLVRYYYKQEDL